jgi:hypothetical protein
MTETDIPGIASHNIPALCKRDKAEYRKEQGKKEKRGVEKRNRK